MNAQTSRRSPQSPVSVHCDAVHVSFPRSAGLSQPFCRASISSFCQVVLRSWQACHKMSYTADTSSSSNARCCIRITFSARLGIAPQIDRCKEASA